MTTIQGKDTIARLTKLLMGNTIASLSIASIINAGLGCFPLTAANLALTNWTGLSLGTVGMLFESLLLLYATYKGEGIGLTSIVNATYGSYAIDIFARLLPKSPIMLLGLLLAPIGWALMGEAGYGDTGSNIVMNALVKSTKKSIGLIRGIQEVTFLIIGFLGARHQITWLTIALSLGLGYLLQIAYKLLKYDPTKIQHMFIIKGGR